jgi:uncharacterized protein HemX
MLPRDYNNNLTGRAPAAAARAACCGPSSTAPHSTTSAALPPASRPQPNPADAAAAATKPAASAAAAALLLGALGGCGLRCSSWLLLHVQALQQRDVTRSRDKKQKSAQHNELQQHMRIKVLIIRRVKDCQHPRHDLCIKLM